MFFLLITYAARSPTSPNAGAKVRVAYTAALVDGTVFEERTEAEPLEFVTEEGAGRWWHAERMLAMQSMHRWALLLLRRGTDGTRLG